MNVTVYCCKRGVKHRIKDVKHSIQSVTVDETNLYYFLTCWRKGRKLRRDAENSRCGAKILQH